MRERTIQNAVLLDLGCQPDLILMRNTVGVATEYNPGNGRTRYITYGLGEGSADLVGILRRRIGGRSVGQWFCLEVKRPGEKAEDHQSLWARTVREMGGFVATVCSVEEARAALDRARNGELE
jgi:hypothetical protein